MTGIILFDHDGRVTKYVWPGGYRVWYITHDGADLCAECVQENLELCSDSTADIGWRIDGWYHEGAADSAGPCDHCGRIADIGNDEEEGTV